jgi:hypothetical protein
MTPDQIAEIARLRDRQVTPKQIARKLGLRPAEVSAVIQQRAAQQNLSDKGELAPIDICWANREMVNVLLSDKPNKKALDQAMGMGAVMIARNDRGRFITSVFLVDYFCLGIKDAIFKTFKDSFKYSLFQETAFRQFDEGSQEISLAQAQAIVFGAVDYAQGLGFEPHRDFARAKGNLGDRLPSLQSITFGKDGQPFYISGPYDNVDKITRTLNNSVGQGNYHFLMLQ